MPGIQSRLKPNEEEVAAKVLDGEAILINLSNGAYYSTDKVGAFIWELVEARYSPQEMAVAVAARYDVGPAQAQADVDRLVAELIDENLAGPSDDAAPGNREPQPAPEGRLPYESPQLNIYRDMADLLALDPPTPGLKLTPWE